MKNTISEITLKYTPITNGRLKINNGQTAYKALLNNWNMDTIALYEEFKVLLLNNANEVLGIHTLSKGGTSATMVDLKLLFAVVLKAASHCIILAHNHPSGNLKPSTADINLYIKIKKVAKYLDVLVLDNLIISKNGYFSFENKL